MSIGMNTGIVMYVARTLGGYVKDRRDALGLNQTELSDLARVPRTTVNRIETGTTQLPSADIRRKLAKALGVSHIDLLIAAGELDSDEVAPLGIQGVVDADPEREALLAKLRRVRLTPKITMALDSLLNIGLDTGGVGDRVEERTGTG